MADKTIDQLTALGTLADATEASEFEAQVVGLPAPDSRKVTLPQLRLVVDDMTALVAIVGTGLTATANFAVQDAALADPTTRNVRKIVLAQMRNLMRGGSYTLESPPKVGTTAGWVVAAANNVGKMATIPASQTASTLVVPVSGLREGDVITGFALEGSIQSAGNTGTITADLRVLTAASAGATDASIGAMAAPLSVTANTAVSSANAAKTGLSHVVIEGESYYVLITSTTGAAVTEELQAVRLTIA